MKLETGTSLIDRCGIKYFQGASVFGALSPAAIEYLLESGRVLQLDKGDVVYEPGDKGDKFMSCYRARFLSTSFIRANSPNIRDHLFGEEIGFVAMIALHDRVGKAVAAQDGYVLEVPCSLFHDLRDKLSADFGLFLLNLSREMARTIREVSNLIVENEIARRASKKGD